MVMVKELSDHDMANHSMVAERLIEILSNDVIFLMTDEAHFHCVNKPNYCYWAEKIHSSSINGLFTMHM
jgi:hypothetical protein